MFVVMWVHATVATVEWEAIMYLRVKKLRAPLLVPFWALSLSVLVCWLRPFWVQFCVVLSCMMAFCLNYTIFLNTTLNSALTQTMCGNLKVCPRLIVFSFSLIMFCSTQKSDSGFRAGSRNGVDWVGLVWWTAIRLGTFWPFPSQHNHFVSSLMLGHVIELRKQLLAEIY